MLEEDSESDIDDSDDNKSEQETVKSLMLDKKSEASSMKESDYDGIEMLVPRVIDLEIGNDLNELKNDNDVQYCLINGDSDDESSESGFMSRTRTPNTDSMDTMIPVLERMKCAIPLPVSYK